MKEPVHVETPPVGRVDGKKEKIESMFDSIAPRYDLLNRVLSLGIDQSWRRKAVAQLEPFNPKSILDVATGTADLAIMASRLNPDKIVGVDISEEMLTIGRQKIKDKDLDHLITLERGDAENLPFDNDIFDGALVAFGVRNFEDLNKGMREIHRVIKPGGALIVLEFSKPAVFPMKQAYTIYSKYVMPRIGGAVSGNAGAYNYLPSSVQEFPDGEGFLEIMRTAGFIDPYCTRLTTGIASLYRAVV